MVALAAVLVTGCYDESARSGETVRPTATAIAPGESWLLVATGGDVVFGGVEIVAEHVEVSGDGKTVTAFFHGGNPYCNAVSGLSVERRDPEPPIVRITYGSRFGVTGCSADLPGLAVHVPLVPPLER
jgi:hypothetical protein